MSAICRIEKRETALDIHWKELPIHSEARKTNGQHFRGKSSAHAVQKLFQRTAKEMTNEKKESATIRTGYSLLLQE